MSSDDLAFVATPCIGKVVSSRVLLAASPRKPRVSACAEQPSRRSVVRWIGAAAAASVAAAVQPARAIVPVDTYAKPKKAKKPEFVRDGGIAYADLKVGNGAFPASGDFVIVEYIAYLSDGTVFDNTSSAGRKPLVFQMGQNKVVPGLELGISSMQMGGRRLIIMPPELAYGEKGVCFPDQGCLIPPGETLEYDVTLQRVAVSPI